MGREPLESVASEGVIAEVYDCADDRQLRPRCGIAMAEDRERLAECFGTGVEGRVGGACVDRGRELIRWNSHKINAGVIGSKINTHNASAPFVESGKELCGLDAGAAPAVVIDVCWGG